MERAESNFEWLLPDSQRLQRQCDEARANVHVRVYREVDSTQDLLARMPAEELKSGLLVVADFQSSGRGRRDRQWQAQPGQCAMFSLLIHIDEVAAAILPMAAGVAAAHGISRWVPRARLKWPNDLIVEDTELRKLGGMVISLRRESDALWASIGIGINLNFGDSARPTTQAAAIADFLVDTSQDHPTRDEVVVAVITKLQQLLAQPTTVVDQYRELCASLGKSVRVELSDGSQLTGQALEVAEDGGLVVFVSGERHVVTAADVIHLR